MIDFGRRYEILNSLPAYGPMYIPVSESGEPYYSEGYPVRLYKSDGTDWVANFKPGWSELAEVFELNDTSNLLVVAYGQCYIMDPEENKPISAFGGAYAAAFITQDRRVVLQDETGLTVVDSSGQYWHSERISWDGLKVLKVEGNLVTGIAFDPMFDSDEWVDFTYDIDSNILIGGSYGKTVKKQNWWRFW
ncbi:hypothetical protein [Desertivirga xinjiangensis]|uniref:hypothetical protein n=1 Tax=Desertivirga xinjiangensis TaxID=539206 RepID=UPI00210B82F4|nr:hypothetical protein [Pedobacter xinjiangensis]